MSQSELNKRIGWGRLDEKVVRIAKEILTVEGRRSGTTTGGIIYNDGQHILILTCGHGLADYFKNPSNVTFAVSIGGEPYVADVVSDKEDAAKEVGILHCLSKNVGETLEFSSGYEDGDQLYMSSFTYGIARKLHTQGMLGSFEIKGVERELKKITHLIECDIEGGEGSSGAPIVNEEQKLVAINVGVSPVHCETKLKARIKSPHGIRLGVPVDFVLKVIQELYERKGLVVFDDINASNVSSFLKDIVADQYLGSAGSYSDSASAGAVSSSDSPPGAGPSYSEPSSSFIQIPSDLAAPLEKLSLGHDSEESEDH